MESRAVESVKMAINGDIDEMDPIARRAIMRLCEVVDANFDVAIAEFKRTNERQRAVIWLLTTVSMALVGGLITAITALMTG